MIVAPIPSNESERLAALRRYDVLDSEPEQGFDDLTELASRICGAPIALVSLVDAHRQWFKSRVGIDATETSRDVAFCSHAILQPDSLLVVPDAFRDPRFADNPLVTGKPHVRFYAGAPLVVPGSSAVGTLCVIDHITRTLSEDQIKSLSILARQVVSQLELRKNYADLKALAADLRRSNAELSHRNDEIRSFYHTLAHELKTPLTAAKEFVSIVLDGLAGAITPTQSEYLGIARSCCDQIRVHIDDLLDMTRLETGKLHLERRPARLEEIARNVTAVLGPAACAKEIALNLSIEPNLPGVFADPKRVSQTLTNLVTNAIKFTPGGGRITVVVKAAAESPGFVAVEVTDTGIGIEKEHLDRIFERLYQVSRDDAKGRGGLGIGLSLCREIVALHGGTISVASAPGRGSTFSVSFPTHDAAELTACEDVERSVR